MSRFNIKTGETVKIKGMKNKRMLGLITEVQDGFDETTFTIKPIYKPAPKSQLRKLNAFSHSKFRSILKQQP